MAEQRMIKQGSDAFERGLPISSMISLMEAMQELGMSGSALFDPQTIVLVEDGVGLANAIGDARAVACKAGLAIFLSAGAAASVERDSGRMIHIAAPLSGGSEISTTPFRAAAMQSEAAHIDPTAADWLIRGERGMSSEALCKAFFGVPATAESAHPSDPSDLRRCLAFLEATDTSSRIGEAASLSPQWKSLVGRWDELCDSFRAEAAQPSGQAPATFALMQEILRPRPKAAP